MKKSTKRIVSVMMAATCLGAAPIVLPEALNPFNLLNPIKTQPLTQPLTQPKPKTKQKIEVGSKK